MECQSLVGVGLRHPHYQAILQEQPDIGWVEVHSENFFVSGGPAIDMLAQVREHYPISLHGVGLSLGSSEGVDKKHLCRLKELTECIGPFLISEHLSWGRIGNQYIHDLLPLPYLSESLKIFTENIDVVQNMLQREILIENPSSYLEYTVSEMEEVEFLNQLCKRSGAKLLLDVNNIYVSAVNNGWDAEKYIEDLDPDIVKEIHIAGHSTKQIIQQESLLVDTHDNFVCSEVWALYAKALQKFGAQFTLLEWDQNIPELAVLVQESKKALIYLNHNSVHHDFSA